MSINNVKELIRNLLWIHVGQVGVAERWTTLDFLVLDDVVCID